jgi:hypothetical protein
MLEIVIHIGTEVAALLARTAAVDRRGFPAHDEVCGCTHRNRDRVYPICPPISIAVLTFLCPNVVAMPKVAERDSSTRPKGTWPLRYVAKVDYDLFVGRFVHELVGNVQVGRAAIGRSHVRRRRPCARRAACQENQGQRRSVDPAQAFRLPQTVLYGHTGFSIP